MDSKKPEELEIDERVRRSHDNATKLAMYEGYAITRSSFSFAGTIGLKSGVLVTVLAFIFGYFFDIQGWLDSGLPVLLVFSVLFGIVAGIAIAALLSIYCVDDDSLEPGIFDRYTAHRTVRETYFKNK